MAGTYLFCTDLRKLCGQDASQRNQCILCQAVIPSPASARPRCRCLLEEHRLTLKTLVVQQEQEEQLGLVAGWHG